MTDMTGTRDMVFVLREVMTDFLHVFREHGEWDTPPTLAVVLGNAQDEVAVAFVDVEGWEDGHPHTLVRVATAALRDGVVDALPGRVLGAILVVESWGIKHEDLTAAEAATFDAWRDAGGRLADHRAAREMVLIHGVTAARQHLMLAYYRGDDEGEHSGAGTGDDNVIGGTVPGLMENLVNAATTAAGR